MLMAMRLNGWDKQNAALWKAHVFRDTFSPTTFCVTKNVFVFLNPTTFIPEDFL